jgi:hypothetical protein
MSTHLANQAELEVARFLAGQPSPEAIIAFRLSTEAAERFYELVDIEREGRIGDEELRELDAYVAVEHFMRLIKAEAHLRLGQQTS